MAAYWACMRYATACLTCCEWCQPAAAEAPRETPTSGSTKQLAGLGRAVGIWSRASGKLFSLEARIKDQVRY